MHKKNIMEKAVVLLLIVLMTVSSVAMGANTSSHDLNIIQQKENTAMAPMVWDNDIEFHGALGGIIVATVRTEGIAFPADDFQLESECEVTSIFWQGGYFQCQLASGQHDYNWDWRVLFWTDDGSGNKPGTEIYNQTIPDAQIWREHWYNYTRPENGNTYWVANYSTELPVPITFDADTKYWITIQGIQIPNTYPQACWCRHNESYGGILLHQAVIKAAYWGYTDWTDIQVLAPDGLPHDLNYQLFGEVVADTTPPETTCTITGSNEKTVTLTATDDMSGVNYTKYKLDSGAWTIYVDPFVVSDGGNHTVYYYSVDKAGNVEAEENKTFTVIPSISIAIKGGLGITVTIKNTGTTNLTNVPYTIDLDGKLIFIGKSKNDTIPTLGIGDEVKVKDFVIGFGKTGIAVTAGGGEASAEGTVLLFFVIGVK